MSRIYDVWEKLVGAVLRREKDRQLAYCQSLSSSFSADFSSRSIRDVHGPAAAIEFEEIKKATRSFRPHKLLEFGDFDNVYKGWIDESNHTAVKPGSGIVVAVKMLNNDEGMLEHNEWVDEINYLGQLRHPNLVKLIGYSFETDMRFLVYEFMPKGSLDIHLFRGWQKWLPWATRIKIAIGAARALSFLHDLEIPVIYQDIKSDQILLDCDFNAKLRDFSLARNDFSLAKKDFRFEIEGPYGVITQVAGTYGYSAPEYLATGQSSTKCDVYSFGIVLVELISGRRALDRNRPTGEHILIDWAKPYLGNKRRVPQIMDSRLEGDYPHKAAYQVAKIGLQCVESNPRFRPTMAEVVAALEKL